MKNFGLALLVFIAGWQISNAQQISQWREAGRTGNSPETG